MIKTFNSKLDINGNRLNLVVNFGTKEVWFYGCNCFNKGIVTDGMGIREVNRMYKEFVKEGYKRVQHEVAREW